MDKKPEKPTRSTEPPVRRVVNEKVINKKEIDDWCKNRKQK
jgi:hypothetical protein